MAISQNTALFSLLGTNYGGDGRVTFGLPNLQGSGAISAGQGPGLTDRVVGETGGEQFVTLLTTEIPIHSHNAQCTSATGTVNSPTNATWAQPHTRRGGINAYSATTGANEVTMSPSALAIAGGSQPHNNMPPYLTLNFCIALQGVFPPRS